MPNNTHRIVHPGGFANVEGRRSGMMMKLIWIMLMVVGFGMTLPKALPWTTSISENGKPYYEPNAHADIIYTLGTWSVSEKNLLTGVAIFGGVLVLAGIVGIIRK